MKNKIRVLHVVGSLNLGGAETMLMNLLQVSDKEKIEFIFLCFGKERTFYYSEKALMLGAKILFIPEPNLLTPYKHIKAIRSIYEENKFDIVHIHTLLHSGITSLALAKYHKPIITHAHSSADNKNLISLHRKLYEKLSKKLIARYSDAFLSCSEEATNYLFEEVKNTKVIGFNNSIILNQFINLKKSNDNLVRYNNEINFFTLGRLEKVKNIIFILEVLNSMENINDNFKLYIIGEGSQRKQLETYVNENSLSDHVEFMGAKDDIGQLLQYMDVHLMPSLYEGFPMSMLEVQASSCVSLVSDKIDRSVDLGLNIVKFLNINDKNIWKSEILNNMKKKKELNPQEIRNTFSEQNYDSEKAMMTLIKIYFNLINNKKFYKF